MRVIWLSLFLFFACLPSALAVEDYICPMHPHIHGSKGDTCPVCGMDLVPANRGGSQKDAGNAAIRISPEYVQTLGVRTAKVGYHEFGKAIHSYGRVIPSTRTEHQISLRRGGWIKELRASAVGDPVKKGEVLFTFYSPDLIAIEAEYITGIRTGFKAAATEQRLRLYGMDDQAIELFKKKGAIIEDVPFHAPADGVISTLNARQGAFMEQGSIILAIQDFSKVWVEAQVLLKDLPLLKAGDRATVRIAQTGHEAVSEIDYIFPTADDVSREGKVRLVLDNADGAFVTEAPVGIMFEADAKKRLAVPKEAVIYSGGGAYVLEDAGEGRFNPLMVETGISSHSMTEIKSGLHEGQGIVISGQFMIDAESNLSGSGMEAHHGH